LDKIFHFYQLFGVGGQSISWQPNFLKEKKFVIGSKRKKVNHFRSTNQVTLNF
jgi:hypothetical protein